MRIIAVLLATVSLGAQSFSWGVRTGIPITPLLSGRDDQQEGFRYAIGPVLEMSLWRGAGVGAELLFQHTQLAASAMAPDQAGIWRWELPLTGVYRFRSHLRPFVRAGFSWNRILAIHGATACARGPFGEQFYCLAGSPALELRHRGTGGLVGGGGLRLKAKRLWLEPEVRLTHWIDRNFGVRDSAVRSDLNQMELLLGVIF